MTIKIDYLISAGQQTNLLPTDLFYPALLVSETVDIGDIKNRAVGGTYYYYDESITVVPSSIFENNINKIKTGIDRNGVGDIVDTDSSIKNINYSEHSNSEELYYCYWIRNSSDSGEIIKLQGIAVEKVGTNTSEYTLEYNYSLDINKVNNPVIPDIKTDPTPNLILDGTFSGWISSTVRTEFTRIFLNPGDAVPIWIKRVSNDPSLSGLGELACSIILYGKFGFTQVLSNDISTDFTIDLI